jgi:hypothetical protein
MPPRPRNPSGLLSSDLPEKDLLANSANLVAADCLALTVGVLVFSVGELITQRVSFLCNYNRAEPVLR